jgi:hypothetical protein
MLGAMNINEGVVNERCVKTMPPPTRMSHVKNIAPEERQKRFHVPEPDEGEHNPHTVNHERCGSLIEVREDEAPEHDGPPERKEAPDGIPISHLWRGSGGRCGVGWWHNRARFTIARPRCRA